MQIVHVLQTALVTDTQVRRLEIEWQTKVLASFIAHTVPDQKAADQLLALVDRLSLADGPEAEVPRPSADTSGERSLEEIMEHGNVEQAVLRNSQRKGPGIAQMFGQG